MAEKICTTVLERYLNRKGPYVYFYDGNCEGLNETIVKYSNEMASKFPQIKVFQIDWLQAIRNHPYIQQSDMNKLFLIFNGQKVEEKQITDIETINYVFKRAVETYNMNITRRAKNLGSNPYKIVEKAKNFNFEDFLLTEKIKNKKLKLRQKRVLKKKININFDNIDANRVLKHANPLIKNTKMIKSLEVPVKLSDEPNLNVKCGNSIENKNFISMKSVSNYSQKNYNQKNSKEETISKSYFDRSRSPSPNDLVICLDRQKKSNEKNMDLKSKPKEESLL